MDPNLAALDQIKSAALELGMKFGPKLLVAIIIMAAGCGRCRSRSASPTTPT
jgi:hypothetical protein